MEYRVLEKKANEFRQVHGLGSKDAIRLKSLLVKLNILTVYRPMGKDLFSGMAIKIAHEAQILRFIMVNSSKSLGHQHFTICHELYHLFIQNDFKSLICSTGTFNKREKEEYNADIFAAYLLLPAQGIEALIPDAELAKNKIRLNTILAIEQYYSCSRKALLIRLKQLGYIDENAFELFGNQVKRGALERGFDISLYEAGNDNLIIGDYGAMARQLFDHGDISESHYYSLLQDIGIKVDELEAQHDEE